jgi:hypothetical protein
MIQEAPSTSPVHRTAKKLLGDWENAAKKFTGRSRIEFRAGKRRRPKVRLSKTGDCKAAELRGYELLCWKIPELEAQLEAPRLKQP